MASKTNSILENQLEELFCIPLSDGKYGGYKLDLLKQNLSTIEEKFLVCLSCTGIMRNASFSSGKNMCECCCPETEQITPVDSVRETVDKLPCGCPLDSKGCAWSGVIGELETHLSVCEHLMVPCPFVDYGCEVGLVRRLEMQFHLKEYSMQHLLGRIMKVEEGNSKAKDEIEFLKKENRRAFDEIDFLKKKVHTLESKELSVLHINTKCDLRHTIKGKELKGFEFIINDIEERISTNTVTEGPTVYLERYNIQVFYKLTLYLYIYIMRIPGIHDAELGESSVEFVHYTVINSENSKVMFECSNDIKHPLILDQMSPKIAQFSASSCVVNNALTLRVFFGLNV